jgi:hypothetical protein
MNIRRLLATAIAVSATLMLAAGSAAGATHSWTVRFSFVPQRVYQGQPAAISVLLNPASTKCALLVRYLDGTAETGLTATKSPGGRVEWKWNVGSAAPAGAAKATVHCGFHSINVSRTFTVVGGTVRHSKLSIVNTGYSQRPDRFGSGSSLSYGVVLDNPSDTEDAQGVTVQVNFLDSTNHTLQTATTRVGVIGAASTFNLGGSQSFSSQTPVVKLEVVVQTDAFVKRSVHQPAVENIHIVASAFEPTWVGEVDGDIVNDHPTDTLTNAQTYIVLFDSAGNVVGGGMGFLLATLPPGTRAYLSASFGFAAVPIEKATTAAVSIVPTYKAPGS